MCVLGYIVCVRCAVLHVLETICSQEIVKLDVKGNERRQRRTVGQTDLGEAAMGQAVDNLQQPTRRKDIFAVFEQGLFHMRANHPSASTFTRLPRQTQYLE